MNDDNTMEKTAQLENEIIAAAQTLVSEYGYSRAEVEDILSGTDLE